jgi:ABC-type phosphate transport system substrate-binding protein
MKVKQFVNWGLTEGQKFAAEYGYTALPEPIAAAALKALAAMQ